MVSGLKIRLILGLFGVIYGFILGVYFGDYPVNIRFSIYLGILVFCFLFSIWCVLEVSRFQTWNPANTKRWKRPSIWTKPNIYDPPQLIHSMSFFLIPSSLVALISNWIKSFSFPEGYFLGFLCAIGFYIGSILTPVYLEDKYNNEKSHKEE